MVVTRLYSILSEKIGKFFSYVRPKRYTYYKFTGYTHLQPTFLCGTGVSYQKFQQNFTNTKSTLCIQDKPPSLSPSSCIISSNLSKAFSKATIFCILAFPRVSWFNSSKAWKEQRQIYKIPNLEATLDGLHLS